ncbi:MAG: 3-deoxy-8-phosphooctulonate synthase [Deltaproteobacteria bacterium]|nr:3-deoxy-8-phosphooctulonate synthase [Deltaproteobacteria bacterium]
MRQVTVGSITIGDSHPFALIAGPCVIEDEKKTLDIASYLRDLTDSLQIPFIFKASYDKANRTSQQSFRGPGLVEGLAVLNAVKKSLGVPILADVHRFEEIDEAATVLDILQIPAFLCRQTDFVREVAKKARVINVKKGQFVAPWDVANIVEKITSTGNRNILLTERGVSFGYNNLVADMRSLPILRQFGYPVVFDATHSVQLPGGVGHASGGDREMAMYLSRAAVAVGIDALFLEVHPDPDHALCDGPNSLGLSTLKPLLETLKKIDAIVKERKADETSY